MRRLAVSLALTGRGSCSEPVTPLGFDARIMQRPCRVDSGGHAGDPHRLDAEHSGMVRQAVP
jgi:hypothetical protein